MEVKNLNFEGRYVHQESKKEQIVLHHTVSGNSAQAVVDYWKTQQNLIGTPYIIDRQGVIYRLFDDKYWAGHVGDTTKDMQVFNLIPRNCSKNSLGVELLSYGWLEKQPDGTFKDSYGGKFTGPVYELEKPYRGHKYYEEYTEKQISALKVLLVYWIMKYQMSKRLDLFELSKLALNGTPGIYTHTSFRQDKSDLYPDPKLINMLNSL